MKKIILASMVAALLLLSACSGKSNSSEDIPYETQNEIEQYITDNLSAEVRPFVSGVLLVSSHGRLDARIRTAEVGENYIPIVAKEIVPLIYEKSLELGVEVGDITVSEFYLDSAGNASNMISWQSHDGIVGKYSNEVEFGKPTKEDVSIDELFVLLDGYAVLPDETIADITASISGVLSASHNISKISVYSSKIKGHKGKANTSIVSMVERREDITGEMFSMFVDDAVSCIWEAASSSGAEAYETALHMDGEDGEGVFWLTYDGHVGTLIDTRKGLELVSQSKIEDIAYILDNR